MIHAHESVQKGVEGGGQTGLLRGEQRNGKRERERPAKESRMTEGENEGDERGPTLSGSALLFPRPPRSRSAWGTSLRVYDDVESSSTHTYRPDTRVIPYIRASERARARAFA